jgi:hypothetical protein
MFIDKFKILASIAEAVKKVVDEEDVEESGLRKAAYAAHSAGQSHFKFKGKTYPVKITKEHVDEMKEATGVTDYNPPSQGGTRKELTAKYHKTKDPKDAEAARKAGATQNELKGKLSKEEIKESDPLRARYSLPVTTVPYGYKRDWSPEGARKRQLRPDKNVPELKNAIKNTLGQHGPKGKLPEESNLDDESPIAEVKQPTGGLKKACWKGYTAVGMKSKGGRMVPNCVPEEVEEDTSIDEKAVNPYAVGMAAAKKSAGVTKTHDLPKSVITKGHEIAKKIIKKG